MDSSDQDAVSKAFVFHDDKKTVGYKINRKMEKNLAKDEADMKKVSLKNHYVFSSSNNIKLKFGGFVGS